MNKLLTHILTLSTAILSLQLLMSCGNNGNRSTNENHSKIKQPTTFINTVDNSALTFKAKYGIDYEVNGNSIAKYPHFNLALFSQKTLPSSKSAIHIYELTSKDGIGKTHISCDPRHSEKKHFFLEGLHFYYHSNSEGAINIYMPPQLLAHR